MNSTFGARLRSHRERQQISLTTIADQTKIKLSLLEALERDDIRHWPLGIFGRSYLRSYAKAVGLDADALVSEFAESHQVEPAPAALSDVRELSPDKAGRRPPTRLEVLIDSAIDAFHARRTDLGHRSTDTMPHVPPAVPRMEVSAPRPTPPLPTRATAPASSIDFAVIAELSTRLGCAQDAQDVTAALEVAAGVLDTVGLILWMPDAVATTLTPVFAHGYSDEVLAYSARVSVDANNAIAEAFRTCTTCVVNGSQLKTGAVVVPLLTPMGCAGLFAVELKNGDERRDDVRAAVTILAAQLSTLMGFSVLAHTMSA